MTYLFDKLIRSMTRNCIICFIFCQAWCIRKLKKAPCRKIISLFIKFVVGSVIKFGIVKTFGVWFSTIIILTKYLLSFADNKCVKFVFTLSYP